MNSNDLRLQIEKFILDFLKIEDIPLLEKEKFLDHLRMVGTLDEKSIQFIEYTLTDLYVKSKKQADELKRKLDVVSVAIYGEQIPEISVKDNIIKNAEIDMKNISNQFKSKYKRWDSSRSIREESQQVSGEEAEVARLKASMGVR